MLIGPLDKSLIDSIKSIHFKKKKVLAHVSTSTNGTFSVESMELIEAELSFQNDQCRFLFYF